MLKNNNNQAKFILLILLSLNLCATAGFAYTLQGTADSIPWSGWWWPKSHGELVTGFNGRPSPVEKYNLYVSGRQSGAAFLKGSQEWYDPQAAAWEGMCNGWVNASILETIPMKSSTANGVFISVGDKKGLLTACHFKDNIIYESCLRSPEPFHRYLLQYIGEQGEVVGADLDSTESFWSYPIYSYNMSIASGAASDTITCTIKYATDFVEPDYQGTLERTATYRYRLDKDAEGNYNGQGEWLEGDANNLHPNTVWIPVGINQPELFIDYDVVTEMVHTNDDEMEGCELVPGHHLLIVYPGEDDTFTISPRVGETITCQIAIDPQSPRGNRANYRLTCNQMLICSNELSNELTPLVLKSKTGNDEFSLSFLPGLNNDSGVCIHLYVDVETQFQSWFYGFPADSYWLGCAVSSVNENSDERVWLEIVGDQGLPSGCGARSGVNLARGGCWLSNLENRVTDDYFSGDGRPVSFKLASCSPYQSLLLAGNGHTLRGPVNSTETTGHKLVIPWLTRTSDMRKSAAFYLANQDDEDAYTEISYFKSDGTPVSTKLVVLGSKETVNYTSGNYPGQSGGVAGWGVVNSAELEISGASVLKEGSKLWDQLPLLQPGKEWLVPHLAATYGWQTRIGICNSNQERLHITLSAIIAGEVAGTYTLILDPFAKEELFLSGDLFGISDEQLEQAWLRVKGDLDFASYLRYGFGTQSVASIPLYPDSPDMRVHKLAHVAVSDGWWTGLALVNCSTEAVDISLVALNDKGVAIESVPLSLGPQQKSCINISSIFTEAIINSLASLQLKGTGTDDIKALAIYGSGDGIALLSAHTW